ncbi:hypothetical protein HanRHA438_Chr01g0009381 [Helianthus annuus]|nr:hypothetical protein HanRHA438_Chr01g0009381 [Helianthus annuus]
MMMNGDGNVKIASRRLRVGDCESEIASQNENVKSRNGDCDSEMRLRVRRLRLVTRMMMEIATEKRR